MRLTAIILALLMLFSPAEAVLDVGAGPTVKLDGRIMDAERVAFEAEGQVWVPLRELCEALGAEVGWNGEERAVSVTLPGLSMTAKVGEKYLEANGRYLYQPGGVRLLDSRVAVTANSLAVVFGMELSYDPETRMLELFSGGIVLERGDKYYDSTDLLWLSRIIEAEACGESLEGKIAVGNGEGGYLRPARRRSVLPGGLRQHLQ